MFCMRTVCGVQPLETMAADFATNSHILTLVCQDAKYQDLYKRYALPTSSTTGSKCDVVNSCLNLSRGMGHSSSAKNDGWRRRNGNNNNNCPDLSRVTGEEPCQPYGNLTVKNGRTSSTSGCDGDEGEAWLRLCGTLGSSTFGCAQRQLGGSLAGTCACRGDEALTCGPVTSSCPVRGQRLPDYHIQAPRSGRVSRCAGILEIMNYELQFRITITIPNDKFLIVNRLRTLFL